MRHYKRSTLSPLSDQRSSFFSLIVLGLLVLGCLTAVCGVLCILFGPLLIGAGIALVVSALFTYVLILLLRAVRWALVQLLLCSRKTTCAQSLEPLIIVLLKQIARLLVALLLEWLEQENPQTNARSGETARRRPRRGRPLLALSSS